MGLYEDLVQSLLEVIEMEKGYIPIEEKSGLPVQCHLDRHDFVKLSKTVFE